MRSSDGFFYEGEVFYPFQDMLFNALLSFTFMFLVAFMLINPTDTEKKTDPKAEFLITATWPDNHPDDIDLYVQDPLGGTVWYHQKDAGLMHLDRDDRGNYRDTIAMRNEAGGTDRIRSPINQETVTLRGFIPGEYIVNVHQYLATSRDELVPVSVTVEKLNPTVSIIHYATLHMVGKREETVIRFTLDERGEVTGTGTEFKRLVRR
ncbi:MAG: hypothetical protein FJX64_08510 [Alphaproteobacteria bacterium]|nr:hypothetical protein [Alphaproteobacteria bacterium]